MAQRKVWSPMKGIPDYSLKEGATPDEIRAMALKAMDDMLSVQWFADEDFTYLNANGQEMPIHADEVYGGLPYTQSGSGLLHWLQFYDFETGRMPGLGADVQGRLGNSCAAAVMWGWSPVVTSIDWNTTYRMTPGHGCLPVGGYKIDPELMDYREYTTTQIVADNGVEAIAKAYTQVGLGDALISFMDTKTAHARMVVDTPSVVYGPDGKIDLEKSVIVIQDQYKGVLQDSEPYVKETPAGRVHYAGHLRQGITFAALIHKAYIPVTTAEFIGKKPYTVPRAEAAGAEKVARPEDIKTLTVTSPYKIVMVRGTVSQEGRTVAEYRRILRRRDIEKKLVSNYPLADFALDAELAGKAEKGARYRLTLSVLLASGTTHTLVDTDFVY